LTTSRVLLVVVCAAWLGACGGGSSQGGTGGAASGGQAGSSARGGSGGSAAGGAGGAPNCSPCHRSLSNLIQCDPSPTATCVQQTSSTTNPDGTKTEIDNKCYSDGTKDLQTSIQSPTDGGTGPGMLNAQLLKNGVVCASATGMVTSSPNVYSVVYKDGSGNVVATLSLQTTANSDGGTTQIQTITCPGQAAEPYVRACVPSDPSITCTTGTCM
jgi:hypothetical protein